MVLLCHDEWVKCKEGPTTSSCQGNEHFRKSCDAKMKVKVATMGIMMMVEEKVLRKPRKSRETL